MPSKFRRVLLTGLVVAAAAGTGFLARPTQGGQAAGSATAAGPVYREMGVSGNIAAQALNALARKQAKSRTRAAVNVHFILNWIPNVEFAGLWVAQKYGWWQKAGINMTYTPWSSSVHPETDVPERGGNTFGFQSGAAIIIARSQNVPIEALYTDTQRSVFGLTVLAKSKIHTIRDLAGKRIGYQSHELYVPETMMAFAGLKQSQWQPVPVGFDPVVLTAGRVDAYLSFLINEPIELALKGVATRNFAAANYGFHFYDDVFFSDTKLIQQNPKLVRTVTGIVARGFKWAHTHPMQGANITIAMNGKSAQLDPKQQRLEMQRFRSFSIDSKGQFSGLMSRTYWQDSIDTLYKYREIHSKPNVATIFTNQFNPNHS